MAAIEITNVVYPKNRKEWRKWLSKNFATEKEVWVAIPKQNKTMEYNDIIEEALCFNWIDSTLKTLVENPTSSFQFAWMASNTYQALTRLSSIYSSGSFQ